MSSIGDFYELFYLRYQVKWYEWWQQRKVQKMFYSDREFKQVDQAIRSSSNPYRIKRAFPYGETPLLTMKTIADKAGLNAEDRVIELGCG